MGYTLPDHHMLTHIPSQEAFLLSSLLLPGDQNTWPPWPWLL